MSQPRSGNAIWNRWSAYWFRPAPLLDLAICRIMIVGFQLTQLRPSLFYERCRRCDALPDSLYDPLPVVQLLLAPLGGASSEPSLGTLLLVGWITWMFGWVSLLGLRTNFCLLAYAAGTIFMSGMIYSYQDFHHPDAIMMVALTVLALSPCGQRLSVDALLASRRRAVTGDDADWFTATSAFAGWPLRLLQWMLAIIYLDTGISKLKESGLDWMNGYTLQYYLFQDGLRRSSDLAMWFGQQHSLVIILSWLTIFFELTFIAVLFKPRLKWLYFPLGVGFHVGVYLTMRAPFFSFLIVYCAFIPWSVILQRYRSATREVAANSPTRGTLETQTG